MPLRIRSLPPLQESGSEAKEKFAALVRSKVAEREVTPRWEEGASTAARRHRGCRPWRRRDAKPGSGPQLSSGPWHGAAVGGGREGAGWRSGGAGGCLEKTAPVQVHAPARAASTHCAFFCTQKLLGFELDADDIKDIEKTLRVKYCGQSGLYGAC